jgi:hypothetical protein
MTRLTHAMIALVLATAGLAARAPATSMDFDLAAAGTQVPYSQLVDAIPTQWKLFTQPTLMSAAIGLSAPSASALNVSSLAEPALGNPNQTMLGQIVALGNSGGADRNVWGIYDRLAVIPAPIVLYFDRYLTAPIGIQRPTSSSFDLPILYGPGSLSGESAGANSGGGFAPIIIVPEPMTVALLATGSLALAQRRRPGRSMDRR